MSGELRARLVRLLDDVLDQVPHLARHRLDHAERVLEDVAHQVRDRYPELLGGLADVVRETLRDPCVEDPLLSVLPSLVALVTGAATLGDG